MGEFRPTFPQFRDQGKGYLSDFLAKEGSPVVLFFCPREIDGQDSWELISLVERLSAQYWRSIKFFWLNPSEEGPLAGKMSIGRRPVIILIHKNQEIGRFTCSSSEPGIYYEIEALLNPRHSQSPIPIRV